MSKRETVDGLWVCPFFEGSPFWLENNIILGVHEQCAISLENRMDPSPFRRVCRLGIHSCVVCLMKEATSGLSQATLKTKQTYVAMVNTTSVSVLDPTLVLYMTDHKESVPSQIKVQLYGCVKINRPTQAQVLFGFSFKAPPKGTTMCRTSSRDQQTGNYFQFHHCNRRSAKAPNRDISSASL